MLPRELLEKKEEPETECVNMEEMPSPEVSDESDDVPVYSPVIHKVRAPISPSPEAPVICEFSQAN